MKNKFISLISFLLFFAIATPVFAGPLSDANDFRKGSEMENFLKGAKINDSEDNNISNMVSLVIKGFLSLLGLIFIILVLVAGFNWMTAGGDEGKVKTAKDTIQKAIIGLIIIMAAYAITYFVFRALSGGGGLYGDPVNYPDYNSPASTD